MSVLTLERIECRIPIIETLSASTALRRCTEVATSTHVTVVTSNPLPANTGAVLTVALHSGRAIRVTFTC